MTSSSADGPLYFWRESDTETGWLSQWYFCPFRDDKNPEIVYETAEHYMMYQKALLFHDQAIADLVLTAGHPRNVKALGRQVSNFSEEIWKKHRMDIVRQANVLKFTTAVTEEGFRKGTGKEAPILDGSLRNMLLATGTCEIVEASPYDKIWGIGFKAADADKSRNHWGLNLLGKALMDVRDALKEVTHT